VVSPNRTVPPSVTSSSVGTGMPGASAGCATVAAPVAAFTSASACQWSWCWCVVTIRCTGVSPMTASTRSGSAAASISSPCPVASRSR
jgi:hypothetical protein